MRALGHDLNVRESGKLRKVIVQFIETGNPGGRLSVGGEENQKFWAF